MALFMIFYKGKHTQLGDNQKRGDTHTHVANYNIGLNLSISIHFILGGKKLGISYDADAH